MALLGKDTLTFVDERYQVATLRLDHGFNSTLGTLHEDYTDRVVQLSTPSATPNIEVYIAGALDLAVSKLGRFSERDCLDILTLLALPHANVHEFERLATEAPSYYVGNTDRVRGNLQIVLQALT